LDNLPVALNDRFWATEPLKLAPGKHTVRAVFAAAISNPVEIEILSSETMPPPTDTAAGSALVWGPEARGLRASLEFVPEKETYRLGERIGVRFHLQNVSAKSIRLMTLDPGVDAVIVEDVDGRRQVVTQTVNLVDSKPSVPRVLKPGQEIVLKSEDLGFSASGDFPGCNVSCKPGLYFVRYPLRSRSGQGSNEGDWLGVVETGVRAVQIEPAAAPVESAQPVRRRWGWSEPVEGVRCRLSPGGSISSRVHWRADETPMFRLDVRNDGKRDLYIIRAAEAYEIAVDGQWYLAGVEDAKSSPLPPGKMYNLIRIPLDDRWRHKTTNRALVLSPGKHSVQVAVVCEPASGESGRPVRLLSRPVEIAIVPRPKEPLSWGKEVNGLRAALEFLPNKEPYTIGDRVDVRLHIQNVSDRTINIARRAGAHPDHPSRWTVADSDGGPIRCLQNAMWNGAGTTEVKSLQTAETIALDYAEPLTLGRPVSKNQPSHGRTVRIVQPGRYTFRYKQEFVRNQAGDWSGELETGAHAIAIADRPATSGEETAPSILW
jgi:hypothetical protein